jgi:hypothetical protein
MALQTMKRLFNWKSQQHNKVPLSSLNAHFDRYMALLDCKGCVGEI